MPLRRVAHFANESLMVACRDTVYVCACLRVGVCLCVSEKMTCRNVRTYIYMYIFANTHLRSRNAGSDKHGHVH